MNQENREIEYHFENTGFPDDYGDVLREYARKLNNEDSVARTFKEINEDLRNKYRDPDKAKYENDTELEESSYYNWLTRFLNMRAKKCFKDEIINKNLLFVPPKLAGTKKSSLNRPNPGLVFANKDDEGRYEKLEKDPSKILVYVLDEEGNLSSTEPQPYLRLTSDQLGFSSFNDDYDKMGRKWEDFYKKRDIK